MFKYDIIEGSLIIMGVVWLVFVCFLMVKDSMIKEVTQNEDK